MREKLSTEQTMHYCNVFGQDIEPEFWCIPSKTYHFEMLFFKQFGTVYGIVQNILSSFTQPHFV